MYKAPFLVNGAKIKRFQCDTNGQQQLKLFKYAPLAYIALLMCVARSAQSQEIEARLYSNAPIDYNFLGIGVTQTSSNKFQISSLVLAYNRTFDFLGQTGKINVVVPYSQLHGHTTSGAQEHAGSAQGLTDPIIRLAANLYGAPAMSVEEFKNYQQDLIIGANLSAALPWGEYNSNQFYNVGANRIFIQPGLGLSQAAGPWRFELSGSGRFFTSNNNFFGGNKLSQNPIYSGAGHLIYYFPSTAWLSSSVNFYSAGESFLNDVQINNSQRNWLVGATLSIPLNTNNVVKLQVADGSFFNQGQYFTMFGAVWQYQWAD